MLIALDRSQGRDVVQHVIVDGRELRYVTAITTHEEVNQVPTVTVTFVAGTVERIESAPIEVVNTDEPDQPDDGHADGTE